jgi:aspartate-semialdehyde dehydrogenase
VIDLSGALPAEQAPQVVPEANAQVFAGLKKPFQISSPSPSATTLAVVLAPLLVCSTCSASTSPPTWRFPPRAAKP